MHYSLPCRLFLLWFFSWLRRSVPWGWTLANALVLDKVKQRIGLDENRVLHVGAAPVHRDTIKFFMKYNLPVLELYGMSENTGPASLNVIDNWRLGSVGKPLLGTKMRIANPDENGEGEVSRTDPNSKWSRHAMTSI